jgi:hypothetical protein
MNPMAVYEDIVFTLKTMLLFRSEHHVDSLVRTMEPSSRRNLDVEPGMATG